MSGTSNTKPWLFSHSVPVEVMEQNDLVKILFDPLHQHSLGPVPELHFSIYSEGSSLKNCGKRTGVRRTVVRQQQGNRSKRLQNVTELMS